MKMLLTSAGLVPETYPDFLELLGKKPEGLRLAYIPTASDPEPDKSYANEDIKRLTDIGFLVQNIDLKNKSQDSLDKDLANVEVVFVEGGNTFYLMKYVRESGFDKSVKKFLKKGGLYIGVSAGSVIAGTSMETAGWKHADRNDVGLENFAGMGLVPFLITPHFDDNVAAVVKEAALNCGQPTIALTDKQAASVNGESIKIVGPGPKMIFNQKDGDKNNPR